MHICSYPLIRIDYICRRTGEDTVYQVHGLTTAASVWLAASVGVACGGGLFFISTFSVILIIMVLKYGPSIYMLGDDEHRDVSLFTVLQFTHHRNYIAIMSHPMPHPYHILHLYALIIFTCNSLPRITVHAESGR
jgi:hypothetical protein